MRAVRFTLLLVCASLASCAKKSSGPLIPDARSPITDVPVPAGFTQAGDSRASVENGQRIVDHRYTGPDDVLPVASFYLEQMPKHNWRVQSNDQTSVKEAVLRFTREQTSRPETCTVTVTAQTWSFNTSIRIRIDPEKK